MKKILSFLMALALSVTCLAAFVGCADKGDVEEGATLIRMIALECPDYQKEWYKKTEKAFNSNMNDGIQLKITYDSKGNLSSSIATTLEGKEQTAIYWCSPGNIYGTFIKPRYAANLLNLLSEETINDLTPEAKEAVMFGDKMYAYPLYFEPSMMFFYSKSVLADAGVDTTNVDNWKWGDLFDACAKVKANTSFNGKSTKFPIAVPWGQALFWATTGMELQTVGEQALDETWMGINLDAEDEGWRAMSSFFWDIYMNGYAPSAMDSTVEYDDIVSRLIKGQFAMTIGYSAGMAEVNHQYGNSAKFNDIGFAKMPMWEKARLPEEGAAVNGGWTYVINNRLDSETAQKAAKVIEFFTYDGTQASVERQAEFFEICAYSRVSPSKATRAYMDTLDIDARFDYRHLIQEVADSSNTAPHYLDAAQIELSSEAYDMRKATKEVKQKNNNRVIPSSDPIAIAKIKECINTAKQKMQAALEKDPTPNPNLTSAQ
ncbi:MAG: carbohydrate ABC transporter substrate-binding protein [Clostridiales bacterium]|nr:carbohydrate ABC transporter substrate-binding protein [Clostridiales bacterium]